MMKLRPGTTYTIRPSWFQPSKSFKAEYLGMEAGKLVFRDELERKWRFSVSEVVISKS